MKSVVEVRYCSFTYSILELATLRDPLVTQCASGTQQRVALPRYTVAPVGSACNNQYTDKNFPCFVTARDNNQYAHRRTLPRPWAPPPPECPRGDAVPRFIACNILRAMAAVFFSYCHSPYIVCSHNQQHEGKVTNASPPLPLSPAL